MVGPPIGSPEFGSGDGITLVPGSLVKGALVLRCDKLEGAVLVFVIVPVGKRSHLVLAFSRSKPPCVQLSEIPFLLLFMSESQYSIDNYPDT